MGLGLLSNEADAACGPGPNHVLNAAQSLTIGGMAGGVAEAISSTATGFFQGSTAFLGTPANATPNQIDGGVWTRSAGGYNDVQSNAQVPNGPDSTCGLNLSTTTNFIGTQVGSDVGMFNINNSGWNVHAGLTGGEYWTNSSSSSQAGGISQSGGDTTTNFSIPFLGVYGAITGPGFLPGDGFFASVLYRHDFWSGNVNNDGSLDSPPGTGIPNTLGTVSMNGNGNAVTAEVGYTHPFANGFFLTPSLGFTYTRATFDTMSLLPNPTTTNLYNVGPVVSELGRVGQQVGYRFSAGGWVLVPTVTGSLWHEFAGDIPSELTVINRGQTILVSDISESRIGTFGQVSVGLTGQPVKNPNLTLNLHVDYRAGENISGGTVSGGLRYQF